MRNDKGFLRVEAELLLDVLRIIGFQSVAVNTASALKFGAKTNGGCQLNDRRLVSNRFGLCDCSLDAIQIVVTLGDMLSVPAVSLEAL